MRLWFRLHGRDSVTTYDREWATCPQEGDHIFHDGVRYRVCQVQHDLGLVANDRQSIVVIATYVSEDTRDV